MSTNSIASAGFDSIKFELERENQFKMSQKLLMKSDFEIDSESDWCGSIYRVWRNHCLLGVFYQKQGKWVAEPYYLNYRCLNLSESLGTTFRSNELAIRPIIGSYQGTHS